MPLPGPEPGPMPLPRPGPEPWPMLSLPRPRPTPLPPPCQLYPVLLEASCQPFHVPEPGPAPLPSLLEDLSCQPFLSPWPDQLCDSSVPCGPSSSHALPRWCHPDMARPRDTQCVLPRPCQNGGCPIMHKSLLSLLHTSAHILLLPCTLCLLLHVAIHGLYFMQRLGHNHNASTYLLSPTEALVMRCIWFLPRPMQTAASIATHACA